MGHRFFMRAALLAFLAFALAPAAKLRAQSYVPTPEELDQLLAPIALYPDALLAQITTASTNPQEILDADDWLRQNSGLQGQARSDAAEAQGFDPAFVALVNFPQVLDMMAQNIDDYASIGAAFADNPDEVTASVQHLREMAYNSGALRSTPQQRVSFENTPEGPIIEILPANPQFVYVPTYNPEIIYNGVGLSPGLIVFGGGIGLGWGIGHPWGWGNWGWNWRTRALLYNRQIWRPQYNRYRSRRPFQVRPPNYSNRPEIRTGRPGSSRPSTRPTRGPNRPGAPTNRPTRPNQPQERPQSRPSNGPRPAPSQPRSTNRPTRPNQPQERPQPNPSNGPRPTPSQPRSTNRPTRPNQPQGRPQAGPSGPARPTNGVRPAPVPSHSRNAAPSNEQRPAQPRTQPGREGNTRTEGNPGARPQQQRQAPERQQEAKPEQQQRQPPPKHEPPPQSNNP